ncbi:MAG: hypothetical protein ACPGYT_03490 [Nitrospirales bacterium]
MNWTTLLRYRIQVEDVIREEVMMAELEKSKQESSRVHARNEMDRIAIDLDRSLQSGVESVFAEQRFGWLEETGVFLERQVKRIYEIDGKLEALRARLRQAHHARRVVEIVIEKKEAAYMKKLAQQEQVQMEEVTAHKHVSLSTEELA